RAKLNEIAAQDRESWQGIFGDPQHGYIEGLAHRSDDLVKGLTQPQLLAAIVEHPEGRALIEDLIDRLAAALSGEESFADFNFYLSDPKFMKQVYEIISADLSEGSVAWHLALALAQDTVALKLRGPLPAVLI